MTATVEPQVYVDQKGRRFRLLFSVVVRRTGQECVVVEPCDMNPFRPEPRHLYTFDEFHRTFKEVTSVTGGAQ